MSPWLKREFEVPVKASEEIIWSLISDAKSIPKYWHGTRWILHVDGDRYRVRFAFPAHGIIDMEYDQERRSATETYVKGPFRGVKTVSVKNTGNSVNICASWNIKYSFPYLIFARWMRKHMSMGTANALKRIRLAAEEKSRTHDTSA